VGVPRPSPAAQARRPVVPAEYPILRSSTACGAASDATCISVRSFSTVIPTSLTHVISI
jgi:hypothetical protein